MNILPHDEVIAANAGGDLLLYRYVDTVVFQAYEPVKTDEEGKQFFKVTGEGISTTLIARVEGNNFYCKWLPLECPAETCLESGILIKDSVVARRMFPALAKYSFKAPD